MGLLAPYHYKKIGHAVLAFVIRITLSILIVLVGELLMKGSMGVFHWIDRAGSPTLHPETTWALFTLTFVILGEILALIAVVLFAVLAIMAIFLVWGS